MDEAVQAFIDKWAEKSAAKQEALAALGAAKLADWHVEDALSPEAAAPYLEEAQRQWDIVEARGIRGDEGRLYDEAFAIAEAYVANHPELTSFGEQFESAPDLLVKLIAEAGKDGRDEMAARLTMFELVYFERRNITQALAVKTRKTNGR